MNFNFVTITVEDIDVSIKFYEDTIGLELLRRFPLGPDTEVAFLGFDGKPCIEFMHNKGQSEFEIGKDISVGFATDDARALYDEFKAKGITLLSDVIAPDPGVYFFYAQDPNGLKIEFLQEPKA